MPCFLLVAAFILPNVSTKIVEEPKNRKKWPFLAIFGFSINYLGRIFHCDPAFISTRPVFHLFGEILKFGKLLLHTDEFKDGF